MIIYYFNFSTWNAELGVVLEELFVAPAFRGRGYAKRLIEALAVIAQDNNCIKMDWVCLKDNTPALQLYDGVGAKVQDWALLKVDRRGIADLAQKVAR